jgi:hypothetical protein
MKHKERSTKKKGARQWIRLGAILLLVGLCGAVLLNAAFPRKYSDLVEEYTARYEVEPALV